MNSLIVTCPACESTWQSGRVTNVALDGIEEEMFTPELRSALKKLEYSRCRSCRSLIATDRRRDPELLGQIYRELPASYWQDLSEHPRLLAALQRLLPARGGDLWDVGCGDGHLLGLLPKHFKKHGIEPGAAAVAKIDPEQIDIHCGTASELAFQSVADAIICIDVVEHLVQPKIELSAMYRMLRPGGLLFVYTGDASSLFSQLAGASWTYTRCVGHITVLSNRALIQLLVRSGFSSPQTHRVPHSSNGTIRQWGLEFAKNQVRKRIGRKECVLPLFFDHQLVVATKPRSAS